ncbi:MAG TPA: acetyl-CoA carboxylase biotin carboxyl carrier protein subunit [Candidatus Atribacteria bacterium]|nr:acetyl-CoA carboxylase biotin carboxyl carrier protein subunit [Candidatus Atribacteria bacterium]
MEGTTIRVPMVGKVIEVKKKVGDKVNKKEIIAVLDSMKMRVPIFSTIDGVIQELNATPGQVLSKGHVLAVIA